MPEGGRQEQAGRALTRRGALGLAGAVGAAAAVGAGGVAVSSTRGRPAAASPPTDVVPFYGEHQAGIVTPAQDRLHFAAFDVTTTSRAELRALLREWTDAARRLTRGQPVGGGTGGPRDAPADDTGEAIGLGSARLTLTLGLGTTLFAPDRLGLQDRRPAALVDLPPFAADLLDPARSGGDLCLQACADDPTVAVHAVRNLARIGRGVTAVRWSQLGFGRTSSTSRSQDTPRNLFGFKDGTANLTAEDTAALQRSVWVQPGDDPTWMVGGSYLVARRISMLIEVWDRSSLADQEATIGRAKGTGAPLGASREFDPVDVDAVGPDGLPIVPVNAHVRLARPASNDGAALLRRGYSFTDGSDGLGHLDAGLFFLAYQRDTREQFIRINARLAAQDALMEYVRHTGSAHFAVPPGVRDPGDFWARELLA